MASKDAGERTTRYLVWSFGAARLLGLVLALGLGAATAGAQSSDIWFSEPRGQLGFRFGMAFARANSDIYDFVTDQLTLEKGDFNAPTFGFDVALGLRERLDVVLGLEYSRTTTASEFRDYIGDDGLPITQETRLTLFPMTASIKYYVTPRGRPAGRLAWVPAKAAAYVGGGGGPVWHRFEQWGEFVDFTDLSVFQALLRSSGWAFMAHLFGGAEVKLGRRLVLTLEARYAWASASVGQDFVGFESIDLSGLRTTAGVAWRF